MNEERIELQRNVERNMKPMLSECIQEAVHLALIDSAIPSDDHLWSDEERAAMEADIHAIPSEAIANMDARALAQNVVIRLLGKGGWGLPTPQGSIYTGNATTREVFDATFERPDRADIAELAFDIGLKPTDDGMFEMPDPEEDEE